MDQAQGRQGPPQQGVGGDDPFTQDQGDDQQDRRAGQARPGHHPRRRLAGARLAHGDEIEAVPEGGGDREGVAEVRPGPHRAGAGVGQGHDHRPGDGHGQADQEQAAGALLEQEPGRQGDQHRGQVRQDGGVGHAGEADAVVPAGQVQGEHQARGQVGRGGPAHAALAAEAQGDQDREGEDQSPEARRGRAGLRQPHEDRRRADGQGPEDEGRHGQALMVGLGSGFEGRGGHGPSHAPGAATGPPVFEGHFRPKSPPNGLGSTLATPIWPKTPRPIAESAPLGGRTEKRKPPGARGRRAELRGRQGGGPSAWSGKRAPPRKVRQVLARPRRGGAGAVQATSAVGPTGRLRRRCRCGPGSNRWCHSRCRGSGCRSCRACRRGRSRRSWSAHTKCRR